MSIFVIGDLHLSLDERVDKAMDVFGDVWVDYVDKLKTNWQENIEEDDTVIIAGDISWGMKLNEAMADLEWISKLNGNKVLLKGNHDLWWNGINKLNSLFNNMFFLQNTYYPVGNIAICGTRGWICSGSELFTKDDERIYKREMLRLEASLKSAVDDGYKEIIGVLHYPPTNEKRQPSGFTQLFEKYGVKKVFYGHLHNEDAKKNKSAVNFNGVSYKLISLDAIDAKPFKVL